MTIASTSSKVSYLGDAVTTVFPIPFPFLDDSHIEARLRTGEGTEIVWTLGTQYALSGAGLGSGGALSVSTSPVDHTPGAETTVVIRRIVPNVQEIDYPEGGAFPARAHEQGLDLAVMRDQQLDEALRRTLRFPVSDPPEATGELPNAIARGNRVLGFDAAGSPIVTAAPEGGNVVTPFMAGMLDDASAPAARATLGSGMVGDAVFTAATPAAARGAMVAAGLASANVFLGTQTWRDGGNIASAAALILGDGNIFTVTGTTAITSIGTKGVGTIVFLRFSNTLALTHHATDLVLPAGADIQAQPGDWAILAEYAAGDWRMIAFSRPHQPYALLEERKPSGTDAGASSAATWHTRALNTMSVNTGPVVTGFAAGQVQLGPGSYYIRGAAPVYGAQSNQLRLRNLTAGATALTGLSSFASADGPHATVQGIIVLPGVTNLELQHYIQTANSQGLGIRAATGEPEVYATLEIWRLQ